MADTTEISWCDSTFNPWIGCTKVSPGCDNCYAEREFDHRHHRAKWGHGQERQRTSKKNWNLPLRWNAKPFVECMSCGWRGELGGVPIIDNPAGFYPPVGRASLCPECNQPMLKAARRRVFCSSLADVFDNEVPEEWRADLFALIDQTPNLDWLLLTKRIGNVGRMIPDWWSISLPPNVWIGATIVNQEEADRDIPKLLAVKAHVRFVSMEPLLGPVDLTATPAGDILCRCGGCMEMTPDTRLDWVIVGGESGPKARPMHPDWVRSLRDQCEEAGVPFIFKQWGEWGTCYERSDGTPTFREFSSIQQWISKATTWVRGGICLDKIGRQLKIGADFYRAEKEEKFPVTIMHRVGKKLTGRLLDGKLHNEFPEAQR